WFLLDSRLARNFVVDWEHAARAFLATLYRDVLMHPEDERLAALYADVQKYPGMPASLREPDLGSASGPTFTFRLRPDGLEPGFFTPLTAFTGPETITLEEIRIESYFPIDEATARACERFATEA